LNKKKREAERARETKKLNKKFKCSSLNQQANKHQWSTFLLNSRAAKENAFHLIQCIK
jgi:hypothetical protein